MDYFSNFDLHTIIRNIVATILIVGVALVVSMLLARAFDALESRAKLSKALLLPLRLIGRYALVFVTLLLVLSTYGVPIGNFWTFISTLLGLIAIGFVAVWSMLSNVSATFLLLIFQPFRVGDYVRLIGDEAKGVVIDITFMFTTIRSHSGDVYRVPNNIFFQKTTLIPADTAEPNAPPADAANQGEIPTPDHSKANLEGIRMNPAPRP